MINGRNNRLTEAEYDAMVAAHAGNTRRADAVDNTPMMAGGAIVGGLIGALIYVMLRQGGYEDRDVAEAYRMFAGGVGSGWIAAFAVIHWTPRFERIATAIGIGTSLSFFVLSTILVAGGGMQVVDLVHFAAVVLVSLALGVPGGLFIRDLLDSDYRIARPDEPAGVVFMMNRRMRRTRTTPRREAIMLREFPVAWRAVLLRNVPAYKTLKDADRVILEKQVLIFVEEKNFEGCGGLEMTDEIRVTVAGLACLLTLHLDADFYPKLRSILVYPEAYIPKVMNYAGSSSIQDDEHSARLGESWLSGAVVLSWAAILSSGSGAMEGKQLVFHEFAHQLDQEDGVADGVPLLTSVDQYRSWAAVTQKAYAQHRADVIAERDVYLDAYGATNPAEFFAVATEAFFETPVAFKAAHPELFRVLLDYYQQDPGARRT